MNGRSSEWKSGVVHGQKEWYCACDLVSLPKIYRNI